MREPGTVVFRLFVRVGACFYVNAALSAPLPLGAVRCPRAGAEVGGGPPDR